jgi:hypothetical protein
MRLTNVCTYICHFDEVQFFSAEMGKFIREEH